VSLVGGFLSRQLAFALCLAFSSSGCVQQAVLENDVQNAQLKARVLATQVDLELAQAAAARELVELEALFQRAPGDSRVTALLTQGYARWADDFVEAERLEALAAGDEARAAQHERRQADARARSAYYGDRAGKPDAIGAPQGPGLLAPADDACRKRERERYEQELDTLLRSSTKLPEGRLQLALAQRLARLKLLPPISQRCGF
jgi:hypothetical protein